MYKIICKQVPEALLKREAAKNHFRQFGNVKRIIFRSISKVITVEYTGRDAVEKALKHGNVFDNKTFTIVKDATNALEKPQSKKNKSKKEPLNLPEEVMAELDAMGGGPSLALINKNKQEARAEEDPKKSLKRRVPVDKEKSTPKKNKAVIFSNSNEYKELLGIINQPAMSIEEKYKVLDARDKILRMMEKENGAKKTSTKGTCPDMCPEKERLLRVIQHQIAYYEQNSNKEMDPHLAVKQYSRSSADQESPLPHELRPVDVLQATMSYLIHKIMPLGEMPHVNIGEWYHFLWDRTRSIRKDITQQELCCQGSVQLLEQCARFHIHCSARLVAEDPSVFDQKINTENLTKCLQTLKYMYNDLRLKGEKCPNEAEFRGYIILLNLNDANFMWEVQRLPQEIQESKGVKEAIKIYLALNADNFVRFFKLVRETSYLNACILMRYFMQVRYHGIDMILKCYTPRVTKAVYPLDAMTENFGFESVNHSIEFLQNCGLQINDSKTCVILDKSASFVQDLNCAALDRCVNLVEMKRGNLSLGMIVYGGILPNFNALQPQTSFDEEGLLKVELFPKEDFKKPVEEEATDTQEVALEVDQAVPDTAESSEAPEEDSVSKIKEDVHFSSEKSIFHVQDKTDAPEVEIPPSNITFRKESKTDVDTKRKPVRSLFQHHSIFERQNFEPKNFSLPASLDALTEFNKNKKAEEKVFWIPGMPIELFTFSSDVPKATNPISPVLTTPTELPSVKENEASASEILLPSPKRAEKVLPKIKTDITTVKTKDEDREISKRKDDERDLEIKSIVTEIIGHVVKREEKRKEDERSRLLMKRVRRIFKKWRRYTAKKNMERSVNELSKSFFEKNLGDSAAAYALTTTYPNLNASGFTYLGVWSPKEEKKKRVDLDRYANILVERFGTFKLKKLGLRDPIYWKCIISIADDSALTGNFMTVRETLVNYFDWDDDRSPLIRQRFGKNVPVRFSFVKEIGGGYRKNDASGLIFIDRNLNDSLYQRILEKFLHTGIHVSIPIVLILEEPAEKHSNFPNFDFLIKQGIISGYSILYGYRKNGLLNLIDKGLQYLVENVNNPPPVEVDYLNNVLFRNFLCSEVWKTASCYGKTNPDYGKCLTDPNVVIDLINSGLNALKTIVLDDSCYEYAQFPKEFRQFEETPHLPCDYKHLPDLSKDMQYKQFIVTVLEHFMPFTKFSNWPPDDDKELYRFVVEFCNTNFGPGNREIIDALLLKIRQECNGNIRKIGDVVWTDIVELLIAEKYKQYRELETQLPILKTWTIYNKIVVIYHTAVLERFLKSDWFYLENPVIKAEMEYNLRKAEKSVPVVATTDEIEETIASARRTLTSGTNKDIDPGFDIDIFNQEIEDFTTSMLITKRISSKFEDQFRRYRD